MAFGQLPNGHAVLVTASSDGARLWDPGTGTPVGEPLIEHRLGVKAVAFGELPSGRVLLAVAGSNGCGCLIPKPEPRWVSRSSSIVSA